MSSLIRLAIDDARKLNRNVYAPLYSAWHAPDDTQSPQVCNICLAGAVIAGTLQAPPHAYVAWLEKAEIDDREWANALIAVNYARMGRWKLARIKLGRWPTTRQEAAMAKIPEPAQAAFSNWEEFDTHLKSLEERACQLEAAGL